MPEEKKFAPPIETPSVRVFDAARDPETAPERSEATQVERSADNDSRVVNQTMRVTAIAADAPAASFRVLKDPVYTEIEHVLEDGLMPYYQAMNPKVQQMFKTRGEELAQTLTDMVQSAKVQLSKAVELIRRWLMLIPGVSRFFLEQEAKIRADRIVMIAELSSERKRTGT